jgi:hypothetical protein
MSNLTDEKVAQIVSHVTETMAGLTFKVVRGAVFQPSLCSRTALLPIGRGELVVGLSSDDKGCTTIGAALFSCSLASVDRSMMNDSLSELVNMAAGQIKVALRVDKALGLPSIVESGDRPSANGGNLRIVHLSAKPGVDLLVWIIEAAQQRAAS